MRSIDSKCSRLRLHHRPGITAAKAGNQRRRGEAFGPNKANLDTLPVRHDTEDREQARITEITRFQGLASLVNNLAQQQPDKLQIREYLIQFFTGKAKQDQVVDRVSIAVFAVRPFGLTR